MTQGRLLTAAIIASVTITKQRTLEQLKRQLADGRAYAAKAGIENVERCLLNTLTATAAAIWRIEAEQARCNRLSGNELIIAERAKYDWLRNN